MDPIWYFKIYIINARFDDLLLPCTIAGDNKINAKLLKYRSIISGGMQ